MHDLAIRMKRIHFILTGLTLNIVLLSLNRLTSWTSGHLMPFEFLRWLDFNAMLPIPLMSILLYYLLRREVIYESPFNKTHKYLLLSLLFISGVYFFGAGSGDHEVTNYLNAEFCGGTNIINESDSAFCQIVKYNDDEFSHLVYYAGFIFLNLSLIGLEYYLPRKTKVSKKDLLLISANAIFIALGIFANLAFEPAGIDLLFFGSLMILTLYLLFYSKRKYYQLPMVFYFGVAYTVGVTGTILYKLATGTSF